MLAVSDRGYPGTSCFKEFRQSQRVLVFSKLVRIAEKLRIFHRIAPKQKTFGLGYSSFAVFGY